MKTPNQKKPYQAPKVSDVGTVVERTLGGDTGNFLDDTFPVGTPFNELTFS
jgi:hypothetical protein